MATVAQRHRDVYLRASNPAAALKCFSPMLSPGRVMNVRISSNAQRYIEPSANLTFTLYSPPHLSALQPPGGPILGGTLVTLVGSDVHPQPLPDGVALHANSVGVLSPPAMGRASSQMT